MEDELWTVRCLPHAADSGLRAAHGEPTEYRNSGLTKQRINELMVVGVLTVQLAIYDAGSLKDKRRVIKSLKDRLANRFNVSVAEVDDLDSWQRAELGVAMVANDARFVESCLHKIVDALRCERSASLVDYHVELL